MTAREKNNKKILYVASSIGHIERFHLDYIAALEKDGYIVETMARGRFADFDIPFEKRLVSPKNLLLIPKIRRVIRRGGYGAIILNTSLASFYTRLACPEKMRPKTVNIVHGYLFSEGDLTPKALILLLAELILKGKTDVIITMNEEDTRLARKFRLTHGKILKIRGMGAHVDIRDLGTRVNKPGTDAHVGIRDLGTRVNEPDTDADFGEQNTPPEALRRKLFSKDAFVLTFVGELSKRKNQRLLIEALKIIKRDVPEACLCLVGDGSERKNLEKYAARLGISDSVTFLGERRDVPDILRASDVYVSAARSEGLPFNIVEALGVGMTVVASRIKGHLDIIEDGVDGLIFDKTSPRALAETVLKIKRGTCKVSKKRIREKYLMYEKETVFPETYAAVKAAIMPDF